MNIFYGVNSCRLVVDDATTGCLPPERTNKRMLRMCAARQLYGYEAESAGRWIPPERRLIILTHSQKSPRFRARFHLPRDHTRPNPVGPKKRISNGSPTAGASVATARLTQGHRFLRRVVGDFFGYFFCRSDDFWTLRGFCLSSGCCCCPRRWRNKTTKQQRPFRCLEIQGSSIVVATIPIPRGEEREQSRASLISWKPRGNRELTYFDVMV